MDPSLRGKMSVHPGKVRRDSNHSAVVNSLRVVNLPRVVFLVRRGPLGTHFVYRSFWITMIVNLAAVVTWNVETWAELKVTDLR